MTAHLNVEIKARCADPDAALRHLLSAGAILEGVDHQVDTYFRVGAGRLKLRRGDIENSLIHYARADGPGPKDSIVTLYETDDAGRLLDVLLAALDVFTVVDKQRHILRAGNVKLHVDEVLGLGSFVEIEAIDLTGRLGRTHLLGQCRAYMAGLGVEESDLVAGSYSDLIADYRQNPTVR